MPTTTPPPVRVRPLPSSEPAPGARPLDRDRAPVGGPRAVREDPVPERARRAAHAVVRMALEVIDRRRTAHQTRGAFPPHLAEMLRVLAREGVPGHGLGPARIHRVDVAAACPPLADGVEDTGGPDAPGRDYEVTGSYARGPRLFAVAARIHVTDTGAVCTALRLG